MRPFHLLTMFSFVALGGCSAALATPEPTVQQAQGAETGPQQMSRLLSRYEEMSPGAERDALALEIDKVAHQRYATESRLYWYTDLTAAEAEAQARHLPILSLRMLGDLGEDLSCANSRLFRTTLYANADVSAYLRDHFVLHWSSERDVPRVTIEFGDGRKLVRTTTGNSAHYVLDDHGHVLDVLPGLYAPAAFTRELAGSVGLANRVRGMKDSEREAAVVRYQAQLVDGIQATWQKKVAGQPFVIGLDGLATAERMQTELTKAQRATMSKAMVEVPDLRRLGFSVQEVDKKDAEAWGRVGQILYGLEPTKVFDKRSTALVKQVVNAGLPDDLRADGKQLEAIISMLERAVAADSGVNQMSLRPEIARHIIETKGKLGFSDLNAWVYADVFHTPKEDAWLGLLPRTEFTGLPGDGVVMR